MQVSKNTLPTHVGIIMDGNRRWAKKKGLAAIAGHTYAVDTVVENLIEHAGKRGIQYLTLWAFSTENWNREQDEVNGLMNLFRKALATKVEKFIAKGARLKLIGDIHRFEPDIREGMEKAIAASQKNDKITVSFALNYGGRDEILRAARQLISESVDQIVSDSDSQKITESKFGTYLDTHDMPDPDLIIRTGGEKRLSGFLMWQAAYSELYFTDTLFPDFGPEELDKAIAEYQTRQRRFGK